MGRHSSNERPRRVVPTVLPASATVPGGRSRSAGIAVAAAAVGFALLAVSGVALAGVDLAPRGPSVAAPPAPAPVPVDTVALTSSPAQAVIVSTLQSSVAPGWKSASTLTWTSGTPFDEPCGRPPTAGPVLAGARVFDIAGRQVVVSVTTYTAGQGAVALNGWSTLLGDCRSGSDSVGRYAVATPGADGVVAWVRPDSGATGAATMFLWRRGDVLAAVTSPSANPDGLGVLAAQVDTALLATLAGRCADVGSSLADAARSPWVSRESFTGLTQPLPIAVTPSPTPLAQPDAAIVPDTYTPSPLPSISYPVRPYDPIWPADLPLPVGSPLAPIRPSPAPSATTVAARVDDPTGPGCGWAFTGQVRPPYDEATEASLTQARAEQAQEELVARQAQWQSDLVAWWREVPLYEQQAALFVGYADAVRLVADAWDRINQERLDYADAVAAYDAAAMARNEFLARQDAARVAYEEAVLACGSTPSPTPTPTPTDSVTPDPTPTGVPVPSFTPVPDPSTPIGTGCPPEVPTILYESPPELPAVPTPPADPRPSVLPTPATTR